MHTVQLLLKPTAYEQRELERRFHALAHIHNVCVSHAKKLLCRLLHDWEYQAWRDEYLSLPKDPGAGKKGRGNSGTPEGTVRPYGFPQERSRPV